MNKVKKFATHFTVMILAVGAAEARGPSPQPWRIYPLQAMDSCRADKAPPQIAARCGELLEAYSRALEACVPMRRGGPVMEQHQVALQQTNPTCAAAAAKVASDKIK